MKGWVTYFVAYKCNVLKVIPNFRIRTIPVLGTSPALFGMAAASWILCKLAQQPYFPEPVFQMKRGQYETILESLQADDVALLGHCDDIFVDLEEVGPLPPVACCSYPLTKLVNTTTVQRM